ncbi:MAG: TonB-dependent receptor domain-containing protein [Rhodanobacteraceae bacterium]
MSTTSLHLAIHRALSVPGITAAAGMALGCIGGSAAAQNAAPAPKQTPETLQTIVVTGSHIRRVDIETSNPVVVVTAQQIQATGKLTVGSVIQDLPVITGGVENPNVNNGGGSGSTVVGLRGLGPSRTLVLIDGQRVIGSNGTGSVDLNTIPTAAVERIEVLTDGASAIYGSDAIGGVINIILKSHYQGAQFQANYGISDHNDGERKGASFMFGQTSDKGSILAGVSYQKFDEVVAAARGYSKNPLELTTTANGGLTSFIGGSGSALRNNITVSPALAAKFGCPSGGALALNESTFAAGTSPTTSADYHCFGSSDLYNYAAVGLLTTPQERTNAFFKGVYHLSDNVDFYATVLHNKTSSAFALAPEPWGTDVVAGTLVSADSYYNPFGVDFSAAGAGLLDRLAPAGNRQTKTSNTTDNVMTGFKGFVNIGDQNWTWDVGYDYGRTATVRTLGGLVNSTEVVPGLGPSFLNSNGVVQCGTAANPISLTTCTPWDVFNLNSASAKAVLADVSVPALENQWTLQRIYHADFSGGLFNLPAGSVQLAFGGDYRREYTDNTIDPLLLLDPATGTCTLGSQCSAHLQGGFNVKEAYAELFVPILKDVPFVHALNIDLGDRYSKYSDFGSTSNWKIGVEYRPISDLMLRGTVSKVFRAPTIADVFGAPVSSAPFLNSDPCDGITAPNPACVGVPTNGSFVDRFVATKTQIRALASGSKAAGFPLGPELGKSFDFGAVYSPHQAPGLSFTADLWRIYLNDVITPGLGAQTVLNLCFAGQTDLCPLITRIQGGPNSGQINRILDPTVNLGRIDVKGVDFSGDYRLPPFSFGQFAVGVNATYLSQYKIQTAPGTAGNTVLQGAGVMGTFGTPLETACPFAADGDCFFPRIRAQGMLNWQLGPWSAEWRMRYISKFKVSNPVGNDPNQQGVNRYGATVYNDLTLAYNIKPLNTRLEVGVDNVFDKQPPMLFFPQGFNNNTDPSSFDELGRYYWARMTVNF